MNIIYIKSMVSNSINKPVCSCGHVIDEPMVSAKTKYSKWGWFLLSMAFSAMPREVIFQCQQCGDVIETSTDPEILEKYRYNSDISK